MSKSFTLKDKIGIIKTRWLILCEPLGMEITLGPFPNFENGERTC